MSNIKKLLKDARKNYIKELCSIINDIDNLDDMIYMIKETRESLDSEFYLEIEYDLLAQFHYIITKYKCIVVSDDDLILRTEDVDPEGYKICIAQSLVLVIRMNDGRIYGITNLNKDNISLFSDYESARLFLELTD